MNFVHGGDIYSLRERFAGEVLDFSANISPLGMPEAVSRAAREAVAGCVHYPDPACRELTRAIARREGVRPEEVLCGNGAADLIFRAVLAARSRRALLIAPCFAEYGAALAAVDCEIVYEPLREENGFALTEGFLEKLAAGVDMAFLCDPNNPTGKTVDPGLMAEILRLCETRGILLVLDHCFADFVDSPPHRPHGPHVLALKAFTKLYALPGLRLGYGICANKALLEKMRRCGQPWGVSVPAQAAGLAALAETEYVERARAMIRRERAFLIAGLAERGMRVYGSEANFVFFRAVSERLKEDLMRQGVLIRSCGNYPGLDAHYYRVAVKARGENEKLLAALDRAGEG